MKVRNSGNREQGTGNDAARCGERSEPLNLSFPVPHSPFPLLGVFL